MLISHSRRTDATITGLVGYGSTIEPAADDGGYLQHAAALVDSRPGIGALMRFGDTLSTEDERFGVQVTWPTDDPREVRVFGLLGTSLPIGTRVWITYRTAAGTWSTDSIGGNTAANTIYGVSDYERVQPLPDGSRGAWMLAQPAVQTFITGFRLWIGRRLETLATGDTAIDPGPYTLGELWFGEASEWDAFRQWSDDQPDDSRTQASVARQPFASREAPARLLSIDLEHVATSTAIGATPDRLQGIRERLNRRQPCAVLPRHGLGSLVEAQQMQALALFGAADRVGMIERVGAADRYKMSFAFREFPVPR